MHSRLKFINYVSGLWLLSFLPWQPNSAQAQEPLAGTQPLTMAGDLSAQMVEGIDRFLLREIDRSVEERKKFWQRDLSSPENYAKSVEVNRDHFRKIIGAVDKRLPVGALEYFSTTSKSAKIAETSRYTIFAVRWPVLEGVWGEGLLLEPKSAPVARIVALPDADQTPEQLTGLMPGIATEKQFARRLVELGCQVVVPVLIDRRDTWSGSPILKRFTNQPHREWIYRQSYEMGRHIIGYEVQKVLALIDWFTLESAKAKAQGSKLGVTGYGEGGLLALYAAALDTRVDATLVSGYFDSRQRVWEEPIYRNVFSLLREFGDAEIASLITPRSLVIEHSEAPRIDGPPKPQAGRTGAAPGKWATPDFASVEQEVRKAGALSGKAPLLVYGNEGAMTGPGSPRALEAFLSGLEMKIQSVNGSTAPAASDIAQAAIDERQQRQVKELEEFTQQLLRQAGRARNEFFWNKLKPDSTNEWKAATRTYQSNMWDEVIGRFPAATLPANVRSRKIYDQPKWAGYDVMLDVWPDVYAWGVLLLPKDLKLGERRPVVVTQHGLEGVPADTITEDTSSRAYGPYKAFSTRLVERGFIVFAPHNPYRGQDKFRTLQRKANPLGNSLFSVILAQHERILDWLSVQPFIDPQRIGFYGLSYGGKTAMRVPALLDRYCLSICSADFNEWIWKNITVDWQSSYMFTGEYEMPEWNLGQTFNYAEMAALIAPRPFMVERGHNDGVGLDEWVSFEYAKIRRLYANLGIPQLTEIEYFLGPHTINGLGTYRFLHRHLNWPER